MNDYVIASTYYLNCTFKCSKAVGQKNCWREEVYVVKMYGVVVTPPLYETEIMHVVYVEEKIPLLFIKQTPVTNRAKLTKQERKDLDKAERNRALMFGDWIEFEERDIMEGCIGTYVKIYPLKPCRSNNGRLQIESTCVFSPLARGCVNECYCEFFGNVRVDPELKNCFLADVAYRCWVSVEVTRISSLSVEVAEYIDVSEEQNLVNEAPWNREDPRFVTIVNSDSDDGDSDLKESFSQPSYPYEICGVEGVLVSERNVYCSEYRDVEISLAYVKRVRRTAVGCRINFNAYYSIPLQLYVVRSYRYLEQKSFIARPFEFGSVFLLEVYAKWEPTLPMGYLWSEDKALGLIHDPDGLLLPILLSKNPYASVCVYVADVGPSRLSRFAVKDLSDITTRKAKAIMGSGYVRKEISDNGLVLGDGTLLASSYIGLEICFDSSSPNGWEKLVPGTWINFTAWSRPGAPEFRIKTWNTIINPALLQIHAVPTCCGYAFETFGYFKQELSAVKSSVFGFIEIPREKRSLMNEESKGITTLWVRKDKKSKMRFVLHSIETPQIIDVAKDVEENSSELLMDNVQQCYISERFIVPCKGIDCEGKHLLLRCFNNRAIVNCLIKASADELLTSIVKLLTGEKSEE
ncbi:unnamed protein product [Litomosoides sigmodontis]|uniref:Uncharacterized protein n=1 Tax=Litomosoides sigmodontis TaxID=42156 RepID=A0A3P6SZC0_LITSI|nr:unnamed protein product [Litomosoides sigmodontis]